MLPKNPNFKPWWITGFTDAEGCFTLAPVRNNKLKLGWGVNIAFTIGLHAKDLAMLEEIKNYFGVGCINKHGSNSVLWRVQSMQEIAKIIEHFDKYPLITQKLADYLLWKEVILMMERKEHLTHKGLEKIMAIKASQNWGLTERKNEQLKAAFPNIVPVERPKVEIPTFDPNWLAGFTSGEGYFGVIVYKSRTSKLGRSVMLKFQLTQHKRDELLMNSLIEYFGCGTVSKDRDFINFRVTSFTDIETKIIPFFYKYPIKGVKSKDFEDFFKVADLMKHKSHLTKEGLDQIKETIARRNKSSSRAWGAGMR